MIDLAGSVRLDTDGRSPGAYRRAAADGRSGVLSSSATCLRPISYAFQTWRPPLGDSYLGDLFVRSALRARPSSSLVVRLVKERRLFERNAYNSRAVSTPDFHRQGQLMPRRPRSRRGGSAQAEIAELMQGELSDYEMDKVEKFRSQRPHGGDQRHEQGDLGYYA